MFIFKRIAKWFFIRSIFGFNDYRTYSYRSSTFSVYVQEIYGKRYVVIKSVIEGISVCIPLTYYQADEIAEDLKKYAIEISSDIDDEEDDEFYPLYQLNSDDDEDDEDDEDSDTKKVKSR